MGPEGGASQVQPKGTWRGVSQDTKDSLKAQGQRDMGHNQDAGTLGQGHAGASSTPREDGGSLAHSGT